MSTMKGCCQTKAFAGAPCGTPVLIVILPLTLLCTLFLFSSPNHFQFSFFSNCQPNEVSDASLDKSEPDFRLLIGILTIPNSYKQRHLLRMIYDLQRPFPRAQVDVRFVFCNLTTDEQREFIALEILAHNDIIILNCKENMNEGKTYKYFSSLPQMFEGEDKPYDYVMKTDDDTYLHFHNFLESLRGKPKEDMYWGSGMPMLDQDFPPFMVGTGYILSWDLIEWIATSDIPRNDPAGPEDIYTGMWLDKAGKGLNRYNMGPRVYNFNGTEAKDFLPETIAVHSLKNDFMWATTLKHFNATATIKPSILYHI
ncbi:Hexosyltransferase [Rhynchospora pubera]|uniref:Hexosyltransferase n=1 Tax=Rhynchospora pubera TaxID=906938 RepID=A0AAV8CEM0_9POAL|nr:Hexosyltransferase [Rhynchospora pubera]